MKKLNHGSLEACQRLADAGTVLETDCYWNLIHDDWLLEQTRDKNSIPAPSMAEVWRELPAQITFNKLFYEPKMVKGLQGLTYVSYSWYNQPAAKIIQRINPTDALIDLLIWVKKGEINNEMGK